MDNYEMSKEFDGKSVSFAFFDTAGKEDYDRLRPLSYPETNAFLLCFSTISPWSFENIVTKWKPELHHHAPDVPIVLIGTKIDLRDDPDTLEKLASKQQKPIMPRAGESKMKEINAAAYHEISSLTKIGLNELFDTAFKIALNHHDHVGGSSGKSKQNNCVMM